MRERREVKEYAVELCVYADGASAGKAICKCTSTGICRIKAPFAVVQCSLPIAAPQSSAATSHQHFYFPLSTTSQGDTLTRSHLAYASRRTSNSLGATDSQQTKSKRRANEERSNSAYHQQEANVLSPLSFCAISYLLLVKSAPCSHCSHSLHCHLHRRLCPLND